VVHLDRRCKTSVQRGRLSTDSPILCYVGRPHLSSVYLKSVGTLATMIKDIVVNLSVSAKEGHSAEDYAISTASALGAHVTGVAFIYDTTVPLVYPVMSYGETPPEVIDALKREKVGLAKEAAERFTKAASAAGVLGKSLMLTTSFAGSIDRFGQIARRFDLAIVGEIEPGTNAYESNVAEGALFCSGRPTIIVPYLQKAPFKLDRVMVCWDGGPQAARAVADAMPLLERAARIELVIVCKERNKQEEIEGADIGEHLARYGLNVDVQRIAKSHVDVGDTLLSHAADRSMDFIVMGAHGQPRMREFFFGGVTDAVLHSITVPVLMSH
jgi:nucleotide-binding universal stress UspA family protein